MKRSSLLGRRGAMTLCTIVALADFPHGVKAADIINNVSELSRALNACWVLPPPQGRARIAFSVRVGFRRNGEMLGKPFVRFEALDVPQQERQVYDAAVEESLKRCTPMPFSGEFGGAVAGRPITLHVVIQNGRAISI